MFFRPFGKLRDQGAFRLDVAGVVSLRREADAVHQVGVAGIRAYWVEPHGDLDIGHILIACLVGLFKPVKGLVPPAEADTQPGDGEVVWLVQLPLLPFQVPAP